MIALSVRFYSSAFVKVVTKFQFGKRGAATEYNWTYYCPERSSTNAFDGFTLLSSCTHVAYS